MFFCVNVLLLGMLKEKWFLSLIYFLLYTLALFVDEVFSFRKVNIDFLQYSWGYSKFSFFHFCFLMLCIVFLAGAIDLNLKYLNVFILLWLVTPWLIKILNIVIKWCDWFLKFLNIVIKQCDWCLRFLSVVRILKKMCLVFEIQGSDWFLKFLNMIIKRYDWSSLHGDVRFIIHNL